MARRRSPETPPALDELWVPDWLRCGRCIEVWTPERPATLVADNWLDWSIRCSHRFRNAKNAWYELHGIDSRANDPRAPVALRQGGAPWSFRVDVERGNLADRLARLGLPADWRPSPAPKAVMDLAAYGSPPEAAAALLLGT